MSTPYSAEDFATAAKFPEARHDKRLVLAALRIAAAVMRRGTIEAVLSDWLPDEGETFTCSKLVAAIRKALTENGNG